MLQILKMVPDGVFLACVVFVIQDYVRFRFDRKYVVPSKCVEQKAVCDVVTNNLKETVITRMDRLEDRFDRVEGLIMNLAHPHSGGLEKGNVNGCFIFDKFDGVGTPGETEAGC